MLTRFDYSRCTFHLPKGQGTHDVDSFSFSAHRKSGMPLETETPAPVKTAMDLHSSLRMKLAKEAAFFGVENFIIICYVVGF